MTSTLDYHRLPQEDADILLSDSSEAKTTLVEPPRPPRRNFRKNLLLSLAFLLFAVFFYHLGRKSVPECPEPQNPAPSPTETASPGQDKPVPPISKPGKPDMKGGKKSIA
jgi:hypothetical protein